MKDTDRFEVVADDVFIGYEIVIDNKTGLHWAREPFENVVTFDEAIAIKRDNWRLPTISELVSLIDYDKHIPACNEVFKFDSEKEFWTASSYIGCYDLIWTVDFYSGYVTNRSGWNAAAVRMIRG